MNANVGAGGVNVQRQRQSNESRGDTVAPPGRCTAVYTSSSARPIERAMIRASSSKWIGFGIK